MQKVDKETPLQQVSHILKHDFLNTNLKITVSKILKRYEGVVKIREELLTQIGKEDGELQSIALKYH